MGTVRKVTFGEAMDGYIQAFASQRGITFAGSVRFMVMAAMERDGWSEPAARGRSGLGWRPTLGFVYLIRRIGRGEYKIGFSANPKQRLRQLERDLGESLQLVCAIPTEDMRSLEADLHERFIELRLRGEWFALNAEQVAEVMRLGGSES